MCASRPPAIRIIVFIQLAFLKDQFDLTSAEAPCSSPHGGDSLRSCAAALGIAYETARTVLKSVFHKTITCRQAELVIVIINAVKERDAMSDEASKQTMRPKLPYECL
jgi:hypothetical protein